MPSRLYNNENLFVGALTNKNYPFELRSWEIKKLKIIDFTDCFGSNVKGLIYQNKILQIEPDHSFIGFKNNFINDKTRYYFDNILSANFSGKMSYKIFNKMLKTLIKTVYLFELNFLKSKQIHFFLIIYQNLSVDLLCLLYFFSKYFYFIKPININKEKKPTDLEYNLIFNKTNLNNSKLCIFINVEPKYENTMLYLILNQRRLKGNLKLILVGTFTDSLNKFNFLGSTTKIITKIVEGLHPLCQNLKYNSNFLLAINNQILKFAKNNFLFLLLNMLYFFVPFYSLNFLSISIYQTGVTLLSKTIKLFNFIYYQFSSIYFVGVNDKSFFNNFCQNNFLYFNNVLLNLKLKKCCVLQDSVNFYFNKNKLKNQHLFYLPTKNVFEDSKMFINTQGLIKKSKPIFLSSKTYSNWKFLRYLFFNLKNIVDTSYKTKKLLNYSVKNRVYFYKYIYLFYLAKTIKLDGVKINSYKINNFLTFNLKRIFYNNIKIKFWLNDFFNDTKNTPLKHSLIMVKFSNLHRLQKTNFFINL